jgi:PKD repeat protein
MLYMRKFIFLAALACMVSAGLWGQDYPFLFMENRGQWPGPFQYKIDIPRGAMFFEQNQITYHLADLSEVHHRHHEPSHQAGPPIIPAHVFQVEFVGARSDIHWESDVPVSWYQNYFLGNDASKWVSKLHPKKQLRADGIWEGVSVKYYGLGNSLKYDFHLDAGVPVSRVKLKFKYANRVSLVNGNLVIETALGEIREMAPVVWQIIEGDTVALPCKYVLVDNELSFKLLVKPNPLYGITIDPSLVFGTYSGSTTDNWGFTATYDDLGFLYSGGIANAIGYPTTTGAFQTVFNGGHGFVYPSDVVLTKYDTTGSFLIWSTYLGGSGSELPHSIICNSLNELFVYGTTGSANFPITSGAFQSTFAGGNANTTTTMNIDYNQGSDIFVCRISSGGNALLASTYVGGSANDGLNAAAPLRYNYADEVRGEINIDSQNNIYVASVTRSSDFPVTAGCFQPTFGGGQDGVIFKMDNSLTTMLWASYFGGSGNDGIYALDLYSNNDIVICGGTSSQNLPTINAGSLTYTGGNCDGFIAKINSSGTTLVHSMYVGSPNYDQCYLVELDANEDIFVFGQTTAGGSYWINNAVFNTPNSGQFIRKYSSNFQNALWSTAFGTGNGTPDISPSAFLVDVCNKIYISGWGGAVNNAYYSGSTTSGLPVTPGAFQTSTTGSDYYLMVIEDNASMLVYATYYGGPVSAEHVDGGTSRFSRSGMIYQSVCAGCGANSDFPTSPNAWSPLNSSTNCNNGVFKFSFDFPTTLANFTIPGAICTTTPLQVNNSSTGATNYLWDFGDGTTSTQTNPSHTFSQPGQYTVTLFAFDTSGVNCNGTDSLIRTIVVLGNSSDSLAQANICPGDAVNIGVPPSNDPSITYSWSPSLGLSNTTIANPIANPSGNVTYVLLISNGICIDTLIQQIIVNPLPLPNPLTDTVCAGEAIPLGIPGNHPGVTFVNWSPSTGLADATQLFTQATPLQNTTYQLVYGNSTCFDSVLYTIVVSTGSLQTMPKRFFCVGDSLALTGHDTTGRTSFNWTPSASLNNATLPFPIAFPSITTVYQLLMSNGQCSDTVRVELELVTPPVLAGQDPVICLGDQVPIGNSSSTSNAFSYLWSPSAGLSDPTSPVPTASPTQTTTYVLQISLAGLPDKCNRTDSITVTVIDDLPEAGFSWLASPSCTGMRLNFVDESNNAQTVIYIVNGDTLPAGVTTFLVPFDSTVNITQIVQNGPCRATVTLPYSAGSFIDNYKFQMPNVFTPAMSLGLNDQFCPVGFTGQDYCFELEVYNRWGTMVFKGNEQEPCWKGFILNTGRMAAEGVYYFVVRTTDGHSEQGFLHLFRTE